MQERRLKAILFSDIVGYTALMGRNEAEALRVLQINKKVHQECINKYNGKLLKEMGDGMLASFDTVSNAVHCAGEIQNKVALHQSFELRIGIHEGEVIITHNDIFGDGVNIASRIQGLAHPGHIWIS